MFNPTRDQARQFFFDAWRKYKNREITTGLENIALDILLLHPEYHALLDQPERYLDYDYSPEKGESNPFLHLALHIAIEEQLAIDQPQGIKKEFDRIMSKTGSRHEALHQLLECLAEMIWSAQRNKAAFDGEKYLECIRRK